MDYSDALKNAPKWIKTAWDEYVKMGDEYMKKYPFLWFVLGDGKGTPPYKMTKKDSKYKDPTPYPNVFCGNCKFYYVQPLRKAGICSWVRGNVDYDAWCKFWKGLSKNEKSSIMGLNMRDYAEPNVKIGSPMFAELPPYQKKLIKPQNK
jgi:hypothetical protein